MNKVSASTENWIEIDRVEDLIDGIEHSAMLLEDVENRPARWKWVILAFHNTLQSCFSIAISGHDTSGAGLLEKRSRRKLIEWFEESRTASDLPHPETRLASMLILFERAQDPNIIGTGHTLTASPSVASSVKRLNNLRNTFSHYNWDSWEVEVSGMPAILADCHQIIDQLALRQPTFAHRLDAPAQDRLAGAILYLDQSIRKLTHSD